MGKDNRYPLAGETVYFGSQHGKAEALAPYFAEIGMKCEAVPIDTDQFGTFSGEVEREGSVKDTLRKKVEAVSSMLPDARFILASEGSFGPHPVVGFVRCDHEVLLFSDRQTGLELFVDELSTETNHDEIEFAPRDDLSAFLERINFPTHAVIVQSKGERPTIFKGLNTWARLGQAIIDSFQMSSVPQVFLSTDMRASFNPTRMNVIKKAGEKLVSRLVTPCPSCSAIGFGISRSVRGLPCEDCGYPTQAIKQHVYTCVACDFEDVRNRHDNLKYASASECDRCNP